MNINPSESPDFSSSSRGKNRFSLPLSSKFLSKGLSSLSHLLLPQLVLTSFRLTRAKSLMNKFIFYRLERTSSQKVRRCLSRWNQQAKKVAKILSGMKILEKQKARREAKKKIHQIKPNPGPEEIQQEKALCCVERIFKRIQTKFKREVLLELVKETMKHQKVNFFLKIKRKRLELTLFCTWKREVDAGKERKNRFLRVMKNLLRVRINPSFRRVLKDVKVIQEKSFRLALLKLEKISSRATSACFRHLVKAASRDDYAKLTLAALKIEAVKKSKLRKAWSQFLAKVKKGKVKKSAQATEVLKRLITKSFNQVLLLIFSSEITVKTLKFFLAIEKMQKFQRKIKQKTFNKLRSLRITRFHKYSASLIMKKISNSLKNSQKFSIFKLKSHSKHLKLLKSSEKLLKIFEKFQKVFKIFSFKSIRSYWKRKVSQGLIWKAKFYQLEGLLQHKKEEISLKAKLQHFYKWKKFVEEIKKIKQKVLLKRSNSFFKILKNLEMFKTGKQVINAFLLMKELWRQESRALKSLSKVYNKQLVFVFFERFKRKVQGSYLSPKNRLSVYTPHSVARHPSPNSALNAKNMSKRYGFYSTKRLSLDHSVHKYIDQMIRVIPPLDKPSSMSIPYDYRRSDVLHK